ncbi:MAG: sugar ABC transporter permease [Phycisphaerae bacterium]|jgi:ABC-type glycerol-3-phosphate transport system permease component|nr:MAG: sugar ABC transporter permease [Phycisphaerae bacterium]
MSTTDPNPPIQRGSNLRINPLLTATWMHLLLSGVAFIMCLPFVWMVLTSLKPLSEVGLDTWMPTTYQWSNYRDVFDYENPDINRRGIQFARFYWNSIFVASWVTFLQVTTSAMAAFAFSRLNWPGRDRVFLMYLGTMMLPGLVMMIPNYQIMIELGLVDTFPGLILPAAFSAFGTFLLRQFMLSIPASLDEAAEIDGASKWRVFWDIILPMSRPGLITLAIFTFMGNYNSFFWPLVMLKSESHYTLPIGLMYFDSSRGQSTHLLMAAVTMSVVPMVVIFIVLQKYLVKGIQLGAVKG